MNDDVLTRNENEELAVRVVNANESSTVVNPNDVYTRDENGNLAIRTVGNGGGGGSDPHNLGWYTDLAALQAAHPTGSNGDFAILGSTDTVWVWDGGTSAWVDSDTKGQVTSVNNQTGAVTVQETLVSGTNIKTVDGNSILGSGNLELSTYLPFPTEWTTTGTTKALCDDIASDTTAVEGKAYLGEVTCSDLPNSLSNAEIVVEIMDGTTASNKVIKLTCTSGNTSPYMWIYTYWNNGTDVSGWQSFATSAQGTKADTAVQPSDLATVATTGDYSDLTNKPTIPAAQVNSDWNANSGVAQILNKPTLGTMASESANDYTPTSGLATVATSGAYSDLTGTPTIPAVGDGTITITQGGVTKGTFTTNQSGNTTIDVDAGGGSLPSQTGNAGKVLTTDGTDASWSNTITDDLKILTGGKGFFVGSSANNISSIIADQYSGGGFEFKAGNFNNTTKTAYYMQKSEFYSATSSVNLGKKANRWEILFCNYICGSNNDSLKLSLPAVAGNVASQVSSIPTGGYWNEGLVVQYVGATDANYTSGYFYKCVSDGAATPTYSWTAVQVQASSGGGLPSQTGNSGKFLTTDGTNASWGKSIPQLELKGAYVGAGGVLTIYGNGNNRIEFVSSGSGPQGTIYAMSSGGLQFVISNADYRLYSSSFVSSNANVTLGSSTYKWASLYATKINNGSDIAVPNTSGTMVVADYTSATQGDVLTLDSNGNAVWQAGGGGGATSTTGTLVAASWSSNSQTINVTGVTASNNVIVAPAPASQADYTSAGIICTAQGAGTLTFTCTSTPASDLTVNVLIM